MSKRILTILVTGLAIATAAHAQYGGGGGMGGGHGGGGHRGGGGRRPPAGDAPKADSSGPARGASRAAKNQISGVIKAIDSAAGRITITYEEADALNWPAGTTAFVVSKSSLLNGATVGEKVAFRIESQQIAEMVPYVPPQQDASQTGWQKSY